ALFSQPVHEVHMSKVISLKQNNTPLFSFGLIADAQYCDHVSAGTRYYRSSLSKLKEAVGTFKENSVAFIINLGDLIDRDIESYDPVLAILNSSGIKTYHCTGNHDYAVKPELRDQIPVLKPGGNGYYSFNTGKFRMIVLNGNEISTYASNNKELTDRAEAYIKKLGEEGAENAIDWNGGIGRDQLLWLETELKDADIKGEKAIIFCHFPIAPDNIHNLLNYKDLLPVVEKNRSAVAWFNGHNHSGNYTELSGKHFITMKGMVETESINSFALVDVYIDRLVINGYGNEIDRTLIFK
ncbi:MAG: metallophosphoesterase, partial [Bacteroidales bacterium]